ncbi:TdeIII family type II restriction endonuclease [Brevibacillus sp. 179-C 1.1 NHS]|uniref:TdeIII family type II restriction endonuclease n=1 Tax=Brevibacillus sp. 179-C 1.1 NHS TaxID=3235177 RepID=UPI000E386659|nr:MAG: TdeIII family type II restriction endonuclease [Brevibacillus sp.]
MNPKVRTQIHKLIRDKLVSKVENYKPESEHKPFFTAIFSEDKVLTASLVHSFYTTFGMSIYEQLAIMLAKSAGYHVERQYKLEGDIDLRTSNLIDEMWEHDKTHGSADKLEELEKIRASIYPARDVQVQIDSVVDIFIKKPSGEEYYIDVKTVKPNKGEFEYHKRKLLRWAGYRYSVDRQANVSTYLAIPYNPFHPEPYITKMWGKAKCMDANHDLLVQDDFWNLVGGSDTTYDNLLDIFRQVGRELSQLINSKFN